MPEEQRQSVYFYCATPLWRKLSVHASVTLVG